MDLLLLVISAVLVNNFVLSRFLGICPFLGVSKKFSTALGMSGAVIFVMTLASAVSWLVYHGILKPGAPLVPQDLSFLQILAFILIIAAMVQLVELALQKLSPPLYRSLGIYLPLITTNCAILFLALVQTTRKYTLIEGIVFAIGAGLGLALALSLMASIRERMDVAEVPAIAKRMGLVMVIASCLSMAFMGFAGMGSG